MKFANDIANVGRGFLMGGADIVPGVSGGTVALIVGIYDRLVTAISNVDRKLIGHVRRREWKAAAAHIDLRFLAALGVGMGTGILGLASLMHYLLEDQEYVRIHSIDRNTGLVRLNVGARSGGVADGEVLHVYRRSKESGRFNLIGVVTVQETLRRAEAVSPGLVIAVPDPGNLEEVRIRDVAAQTSRRRPFTLAAFFGLILGSTFLIAKMMDGWTNGSALAALGGAAFAYWLVGLIPVALFEGNVYLFFCGMLAICAMILPGMSGAFLLLLLGVYSDVTGLLRTTLARQATSETLISIAVFVCGCVVGLLAFSKLLHKLLRDHRTVTMACLVGFMAGSLRKIWPFKLDLTPDRAGYKFKLFDNVWPEQFDERTWLTFGVIAAAATFVLLLEKLTRKRDATIA